MAADAFWGPRWSWRVSATLQCKSDRVNVPRSVENRTLTVSAIASEPGDVVISLGEGALVSETRVGC